MDILYKVAFWMFIVIFFSGIFAIYVCLDMYLSNRWSMTQFFIGESIAVMSMSFAYVIGYVGNKIPTKNPY